MKYTFSTLIFLHAAIHLIGFVKAFKIARISTLQTEISQVLGIFWLISFLLLAMSAMAFTFDKQFWFYLAVPAVIISGILIISTWCDAKYGMIPNVIILMLAFVSFSSCSMNKMISRETEEILDAVKVSEPEIITNADIVELPAPVQGWIRSTGIIGKPAITTACVHQKALMKMKPEQQDWYSAEALQYTTMNPPAFIWTANMKMMPMVTIKGRDKYVEGKGEMLIKMNSLINVVNEKGTHMDEGTLQRFLGELVWYPSLALSHFISWEAIDATSAKATMAYNGTTSSGTFYFDKNGDFVKFIAMRFMGNKADAKRYPWVLTVDDYAVFEEIKVPSKMKATWQLDEGDWTWLELEISLINYNFEKESCIY
ncbi:MAG: hypothetical protein K9J13_00910 [Saprospiraceae bacterium]|nr:hypothetical protein [Saprospiraceae bacterium]